MNTRIHPDFNEKDSCKNVSFESDTFNIQRVPIKDRFYASREQQFYLPPQVDDDSIILQEKWGKSFYQPVTMAQYALNLLDIYIDYGDEVAFDVAERHLTKLISMSKIENSRRFFQHTQNYNFNDIELLEAPWVSALTQGQVLSLCSRFFELTGDEKYLNFAREIFKSFKQTKRNTGDWIVCVDSKKQLWLEEYPSELPSHVWNGMMFAMIGLYDYYLISNDAEALSYLNGSLTTLKANMYLMREKNSVSFYSAKYMVKNPSYHEIHINLLNFLSEIADDHAFSTFADELSSDVH